MNRPRCSVYIAQSVDGFIARPDGGLEWLDRVQLPGEDYGYAAFMAQVDTVLLGRKTWEVVLGFGEPPYPGKRIVVATSSTEAPPPGVTFVNGDLPAAIARLGEEGARHLWVDGGILVKSLLRAGCVDDMIISTIPVLLGEGIPLFGPGTPEVSLSLVRSQGWASGLLQAEWKVTREATPGR